MKFVTQDYYEILDVSPGASAEEVKRAYRLVRRSFRPDSMAIHSLYSAEETEAISAKIEEAFRILSAAEPARRYSKYHRTARPGADIPRDPDAFFDRVHDLDGQTPIERLARLVGGAATPDAGLGTDRAAVVPPARGPAARPGVETSRPSRPQSVPPSPIGRPADSVREALPPRRPISVRTEPSARPVEVPPRSTGSQSARTRPAAPRPVPTGERRAPRPAAPGGPRAPQPTPRSAPPARLRPVRPTLPADVTDPPDRDSIREQIEERRAAEARAESELFLDSLEELADDHEPPARAQTPARAFVAVERPPAPRAAPAESSSSFDRRPAGPPSAPPARPVPQQARPSRPVYRPAAAVTPGPPRQQLEIDAYVGRPEGQPREPGSHNPHLQQPPGRVPASGYGWQRPGQAPQGHGRGAPQSGAGLAGVAEVPDALGPRPRRWQRDTVRTRAGGQLRLEPLSKEDVEAFEMECGGMGGEFLKQVRRALGVSVEDIAVRTKISVGMLRYIEADETEFLPARVYLRGYLTQIGRMLKLPVPEIVDGYTKANGLR